MTEIAARALIGPNLYDPGPAAVAEVRLPAGTDAGAARAAVVDALASLSAAVGWPTPTLRTREFRGGLAFAAPVDGARVEAAATLLERALRRALTPEAAGTLAADIAAIGAAAAEERPSLPCARSSRRPAPATSRRSSTTRPSPSAPAPAG